MHIIDVQNHTDKRNIAIDRVGIRGLRHPCVIIDGDNPAQPSIGLFTLLVNLPADRKGTHMSRFIEILNEKPVTLSLKDVTNLLSTIKTRLGSTTAHLEVQMPYFMSKAAPISGVSGLMDYDITLIAELWETDEAKLYAKVVVPITSLCPCSKEISDYGAHNQRSHVTVLAALNIQQPESFQSIIQTIEQEASCELFSTLKRADEKWVTERAYDNPKFVEDLIRDIANRLSSMSNILGYRISCENFESIHNHSAYAFIERGMDTYA